jgi:hypothetical protein
LFEISAGLAIELRGDIAGKSSRRHGDDSVSKRESSMLSLKTKAADDELARRVLL